MLWGVTFSFCYELYDLVFGFFKLTHQISKFRKQNNIDIPLIDCYSYACGNTSIDVSFAAFSATAFVVAPYALFCE